MSNENVDISNLINDFFIDPYTRKLINLYKEESLFDILNISRQETYHTKFLGWLFNQFDLINSFDVSPLSFLLRKIYQRAKQQNLADEFDKILKQEIHSSNCSVALIQACYEYPIKNGRLDLWLKMNLRYENKNEIWGIIIENKIDAQLAKNQLYKYKNYFTAQEGKKEADKFLFIFLNADSEWEMKSKHIPNLDSSYIHINYSDLVQNFINPILNHTTIDDRRRTIINEYIKTLRFPNNNNFKIANMALTQEDKLLLKSFWNNQESLFRSILEALADASDDEEDRKQFVEMAQTIDTLYSNRDKSVYCLTYKGESKLINKRNLAIEIANVLLSEHEDTKNIIENSRKNHVTEYNKRDAYISNEEYTDLIEKFSSYKDRYKKINQELYVSNQWGIKRNGEDPVENLIKWANTYPFITIKKTGKQ